jgi:hypothetical protein
MNCPVHRGVKMRLLAGPYPQARRWSLDPEAAESAREYREERFRCPVVQNGVRCAQVAVRRVRVRVPRAAKCQRGWRKRLAGL